MLAETTGTSSKVYTYDAILYTYYTYRPDGLRHSIGDTIHIWDGANIVADVEGNDITTYFRGINLIYAEEDGEQTYYHFNAHGDVVVLTDENGAKEKTYSYTSFGIEYNPSTFDTNPFRYCGEYYDTVSGTIYLRARYYNSDLGRFTQEDPIRDGSNWYAYCGNNPIMFVDPSGNTSKVNFSADGYAYDGFKIDDANKGGGNYRRELQMVGNALGTVALLALTAKAGELIAENPPLPMRKYQAMVEAKAKAEAEAEAKAETKPSTKSEERNYCVYVLINPDTNQVDYVGRTIDPIAREKAHLNDSKRSHLKMRIIHKNLTLDEARGLEQTEMMFYHTLKTGNEGCNRINGISLTNPNRERYMAVAVAYFENIISNEFYCVQELLGK